MIKEKIEGMHKEIVGTAFVYSSHGTTFRLLVPLSFEVSGQKISTRGSIIERKGLRYPMIIGAKDLATFIVDPSVKRPTRIGKDANNVG